MQHLRPLIADAESRHVAIGHFNISNLEGLWGIFRAARGLNVPVVIGVSEGERAFVGVRQIAALVQSMREEYDFPIFLNADHTYSVEGVRAAVTAGFDAVIFDGAKGSLEENIAGARASVEIARASGRDVLVEAEIGYIGASSKILEDVPDGALLRLEELPTPEDCARLVRESGADLLAPAVGNIHGMLASGREPKLHIDRIREIKAATGVPLVLHGGSGTSEQDFRDAIAAGVAIVHVNTELRVAYRDAVRGALAEHPDEIAPYKLLEPAVVAIETVVRRRLQLFNNLPIT